MNTAVQTKQEMLPPESSDNSLPTISNSGSTLMAVIEKVAAMPDLDIDRIERLFSMHEKMVEREAETAYNSALSRAQSEMESVSVNKTNKHTNSKYANLEAVHSACKPIWTRHGFSVSAILQPSDLQNHVLVVCEVRHSAGFKRVYKHDWPLDLAGAKGNSNKTAIQAMGSTASYARRYSELMIFDIAIQNEDNDGNRNSPEPSNSGKQENYLPYYPRKQFDEKKPEWEAAFKSGGSNPNHLIALISTKYTLSSKQINEIKALA